MKRTMKEKKENYYVKLTLICRMLISRKTTSTGLYEFMDSD